MTVEIKKEVIGLMASAQTSLGNAYKMAVRAQPLAANIPCIIELNKIATQLTQVMQAISKLRGL